MNCGDNLSSKCKFDEITAIINNNIIIGHYIHKNNVVNYTLPVAKIVSFEYSLDSNAFTYNPTALIGWSTQPNNIPFNYNLDKFVGSKLNKVLGVDVFARLYGGRININYCTVWSAKNIIN